MSSNFDINTIYLIVTSVLGILLSISEVLGWSKCKANSVTEELYLFLRQHPPNQSTPVVQTRTIAVGPDCNAGE